MNALSHTNAPAHRSRANTTSFGNNTPPSLTEQLEASNEVQTELDVERETIENGRDATLKAQAAADTKQEGIQQEYDALLEADAAETTAAMALVDSEIEHIVQRVAQQQQEDDEISEQIRHIAAIEIQRILLIFKSHLRIHRQEQVVSNAGRAFVTRWDSMRFVVGFVVMEERSQKVIDMCAQPESKSNQHTSSAPPHHPITVQ